MTCWISEQECLELLNQEKALKFMKKFGGGRKLYIPKRPTIPHIIEEAVGISGMAALCREFGGNVVAVASASNKIRKDYIIDLINGGLVTNKIAGLAGVSVRTVQRIRNEGGGRRGGPDAKPQSMA